MGFVSEKKENFFEKCIHEENEKCQSDVYICAKQRLNTS